MNPAENILVIRLTAIGDVVLTLPVVSVLRARFPSTKITFLTTQENSELLHGFRDVSETIAINRVDLRSKNPFRSGGELIRLLTRLRRGHFSHALDLQGNGESAWLTRLTGAPQRWGVVHKPSRRWAYTVSADRGKELHPAEMHLKLLQLAGLNVDSVQNHFHLPPGALTEARNFFSSHQLTESAPTLFIQPFTSSPHKNWPLENYLKLASFWKSRGWQVIFGGGPKDIAALDAVRKEGYVISAGVPLLVTGGLMQLSKLIVGGDTGALHLAVAQGKRVVMLMNHNRPGRPHPFRHSDWSLLPPVDRNISTLKLETVLAACEQALAEISASTGSASC